MTRELDLSHSSTDHDRSDAVEDAEDVAREAAEAVVSGGGDAPSRAVELLGRVGLVAYGVVHMIVAFFGVRLALGVTRQEVDQRGAIAALSSFGWASVVLLVVCVAGLLSFAIWQTAAAVAGFRWTSGGERFRKRVGAVAKAVSVLAIAAVAARFLVGDPGPSGRAGPQLAAATLLELPGGRWLVAGLAAFVIVIAATMVYTGLARTFLGDLVQALPRRTRRVAVVLGGYGNLARAVVLGVVGALFVEAAVHGDPSRTGGIDQALRGLAGSGRGVFPLLLVSGGLAAFGVYCLIDARYRRARGGAEERRADRTG